MLDQEWSGTTCSQLLFPLIEAPSLVATIAGTELFHSEPLVVWLHTKIFVSSHSIDYLLKVYFEAG